MMQVESLLIVLIIFSVATIFLVGRYLRSREADIRTASEFVFSSSKDMYREKFILEVAGLIKAATGLDTKINKQPNYPHLDIMVLRGLRCIGVVSVVSAEPVGPITMRIRAIADAKVKKGAKTAYVVSGSSFAAKERKLAASEGVTLLDGAALQRIKRKAEAGAYMKRPAPPPEPTPEDAKRWRRPKPVERIATVSVVEPLETTQRRRIPLPPWVEFR